MIAQMRRVGFGSDEPSPFPPGLALGGILTALSGVANMLVMAHAHLLAMDRGTPGESYIIAGPCHTLVEAFDVAAEVAGRPAPRLHVPPAVLKALAVVAELVGRVLPLPDMFSAESLRVTAGTTYLGDNSKAKRELGYDPRPLAEGLAETLDALRARSAPQ